jgi:hypothetical protein
MDVTVSVFGEHEAESALKLVLEMLNCPLMVTQLPTGGEDAGKFWRL